MSDARRKRWIKFAALGFPLYLAGCSGAATVSGTAPTVGAPVESAAEARQVDLMGVADRLRANGDVRNAIAMYHQAHLANPQAAEPLVSLGDSLMVLGANADAADAYGKALALQPNNPGALRGLGIARVLLAQPQFAIAQFESALAINPRDVRAYNGLGVALDMTGDHRAAQEKYRAALEIEPDNTKVLNNLGLSLTLSGESEESVAVLERVNAKPAASALTRQNLALAYGLSGRLAAAERIARIDLRQPAVERNLAFYAAHQDEGGSVLARTLGVQSNGLHYTVNRPPEADAAPDPEDRTAAELGTGTVADHGAVETPAPEPEPEATGAPVGLVDPAAPDRTEARPDEAEPALPERVALEADSAAGSPSDTPEPTQQEAARQTAERRETSPLSRHAEPTPAQDNMETAETATAPPSPATRHETTAPRPLPTVLASLESEPLESEPTADPEASATAPQTPDTPSVGHPVSSPLYRVQLAAYRSADDATAAWRRLTATEPDLLGDFTPVVRRVDLGPEKGIFFRLRAGGFAEQRAARTLCRELQARGLGCFVVEASPADMADEAFERLIASGTESDPPPESGYGPR